MVPFVWFPELLAISPGAYELVVNEEPNWQPVSCICNDTSSELEHNCITHVYNQYIYTERSNF